MSPRRLAVFLVPLVLSLVLWQFRDASPATGLLEPRGRTIRVAGDIYFPPFEYVDTNGMYKGFNVDIMRAIAIEKGLDLELIPMPWSEAFDALKNGRVDAIQGMKYSPLRDEYFDFSEPYLESAQAIFVDRANRYIIELDDLRGRTVAVQAGDISNDLIANLPMKKVIRTATQEDGLEKVLQGEADAFVGNRYTGLYIIQHKGVSDRMKITGEPMNLANYGLAVREGDRELLDVFNRGIKAIKANGTYEKIHRKWFGELIDNTRTMKKTIYAVSLALSLAVAFSLVALRWNRTLKSEVRRRAEELNAAHIQLLKSDRLKEQILDNIRSGIVTIGRNGKILSMSKPALALTQMAEEEIGRPFADTRLRLLIEPRRLEGVWREGVPSEGQELALSDGTILETSVYPLKEGHNGAAGAILTLRDITREKKMQEALHRQDKLYSLGQLAAGIAHEIRNPLTSIKTFVELIPTKIDKPRFRQEMARYVPAEIDRLNALITDLLEYSRPRKPHKENCPLKETVERVLLFFTREIKNKQVNVRVKLSPRLRILVDRHQFQQILINLFLNALDAVGEEGSITISAGKEQDRVWLQIADSGAGMEQEVVDRAFEPFYSTKPSGTGLGLFVCYQFTKENDGEINITSRHGEGTTVELRFPATETGVDGNG